MVEVNFNVWGNGSINRSGHITSDNRYMSLFMVIKALVAMQVITTKLLIGWKTQPKPSESVSLMLISFFQIGRKELVPCGIPLPPPEHAPVANQLAIYLINNDVDPTYTNLIGHSLGAHIAGFTGSTYRESTGRSLAQIVGLDPAGPEFEDKAASDRLDPSDANRVVSIHTSETLGYDARLATLDVYANWNDLFQPGQWNVGW